MIEIPTTELQTGAEALRHRQKMEKRKAAQDAEVASKTIAQKGLLIVHTGKGKGKSTAAFGMVMRCLGHRLKVGIVQYVKGGWETGERWVKFPELLAGTRWARALPGDAGSRARHRGGGGGGRRHGS
jgi:cob(I)alamin adenosyltransferase